MSYPGGGYPGQAPGAPYGAPQQAYHGGAPYQGYPGQAPPPQQQPGYGAPPGVPPEVYSWFKAVDQDNSNFINAQELSRALQSGNNRNFSVQACSTMMGMFDHGRTGRIDVNQFAQLYSFINQWTEAFKRADSDNSGSITVNEMVPVLQGQGYNISPQTVQIMVTKFGSSELAGGAPYGQPPQGGAAGPSSLGLDGFILLNVQLRRLTDAFMSKDTQRQGRITIGYEEFIGLVMNAVV